MAQDPTRKGDPLWEKVEQWNLMAMFTFREFLKFVESIAHLDIPDVPDTVVDEVEDEFLVSPDRRRWATKEVMLWNETEQRDLLESRNQLISHLEADGVEMQRVVQILLQHTLLGAIIRHARRVVQAV
jgi:hypothetical protein